MILASASNAFAQHGGVSGPLTTGPLNPASGATAIRLETVISAEQKCYENMLNDMMTPFMGTVTTPVSVYSNMLGIHYDHIHTRYTLSLSNAGPLPADLKAEYTECDSATMRMNNDFDYADPDVNGKDLFTLSIEKHNAFNTAILDIDKVIASMTVGSFPKVSYKTSWQETFDPITHVSHGGYTLVTGLTKTWQGQLPTDAMHIPLLNEDATASQTNFRINGEKFFQCLESQL